MILIIPITFILQIFSVASSIIMTLIEKTGKFEYKVAFAIKLRQSLNNFNDCRKVGGTMVALDTIVYYTYLIYKNSYIIYYYLNKHLNVYLNR